jgi:hypothetical protein
VAVSAIRAELEAYKDRWGLVHPAPGEITGNGLCFTAEAIVILQRRRILTAGDVESYRKAIAGCVEGGLVFRHPQHWREDQEGPDDLYGIAVACIALGIRDIPRQILDWGRTHHFTKYWIPIPYYYKNSKPQDDTTDGRAWLGRQPGLVGLLELAAGEGLPAWREIALQLAVLTTGWFGPKAREEGGQDAWRLSNLVCHALESHSLEGKQLADRFRERLHATWGTNGMSACYRNYFGGENWFTKYAVD